MLQSIQKQATKSLKLLLSTVMNYSTVERITLNFIIIIIINRCFVAGYKGS